MKKYHFLVLATLSSMLSSSAFADGLTLYKKNNTQFETGGTITMGAFLSDHAGYGAGSADTKNPNVRRTSPKWTEASVEPYLKGTLTNANSSAQYFKYSAVWAMTMGKGDMSLSSTTSHQPSSIDHEESYVGWRSGNLFPKLGKDAIDFSIGNQRFVMGDGMLVSSGTTSGFKRAGYYTGPRGSFRRTAILKFNTSPIRGQLFHLNNNVNQKWMQGNDQPKTFLNGANIEWFRADEKDKEKDLWHVGASIIHVYKSDQAYNTTYAFTRRDGMMVYNVRMDGAFFPWNRDIKFAAGYVHQHNGVDSRNLNANAYYIEPGYQFSRLWAQPLLTYAYFYYSGDKNPGSGRKKTYDPLFNGYVLRDTFGRWEIGEIYGQFVNFNTNAVANRIHLKITPTENTSYGAIYYYINFDKAAQAQATSRRAADEFNVYARWYPKKWLSLSALLGASVPKLGLKQSIRNTLPTVDAGRIGKTSYFGQLTAIMNW